MSDFQIISDAYRQNFFSRSGEQTDLAALYQSATDLASTDANEANLYHLAAKHFDHQAIAFLAEKGIKARADQHGNTPLHALVNSPLINSADDVQKRGEDMYKATAQLLALKVNPKKKNDNGQSAAYDGGSQYFYPFIEAICDADIALDMTGAEDKNLLHKITDGVMHKRNRANEVDAAVKTIKILLEKGGIDPEDKDMFGASALTYAQRSEIEAVVAAFTSEESGAVTGGMTLADAALHKNLPALEAIIAQGVDLNEVSDQHHKTALMLACEYPSVEMVKALIKAGCDVNYRTGDGNTAVYYLITRALYNLGIGMVGGQQQSSDIRKILQMLIDSDLNVDESVDSHGNTVLGLLCAARDLDQLNNSMAEELIDAGCDINKANLAGVTPLMAFAANGDESKHDIAQLLTDNDVNTNLSDSQSFTALMYAATNSNKTSGSRIAKLILSLDKSSIDKTNNNGESALDLAVKNDNESLVKLILTNM